MFSVLKRSLRQSHLNLAANIAGAIASALSGLVSAPFLIKQLGPDRYGVWALIVTMTAYFLLFDVGLTIATGRLIVESRARGLLKTTNVVLSTAAVLLSGVVLLVLCSTASTSILFFMIFPTDVNLHAEIFRALILMGLACAIAIPSGIFGCLLWGYERFDIVNLIEISVLVLRLTLLFLFVGSSSTLSEVALITILTNLLGTGLYVHFCLKVEPGFRIRVSDFSASTARELLRLGFRFWTLNSARAVAAQLGTLIAGRHFNSATVTTFAVAKQLSSYCTIFASSATQVAATRASALHSKRMPTEQVRLLIGGGRFATLLACYLVVGVLVFAPTFIRLWLSGRASESDRLLSILVCGEALPLTQWVTHWIITGMHKHDRLTKLAILDGLSILLAGTWAATTYGVQALCLVIALSASVFRGIMQLTYGCSLLGVSPLRYFLVVIAPIALPAAVTYVLLREFIRIREIDNWTNLFGACLLFSLTYCFFAGGAAAVTMCAERRFKGLASPELVGRLRRPKRP